MNLKHLVLVGNELQDEKLDRLVEALRGDRGDELVSLDLNGNRFQGAAFTRPAHFLGDPAQKPPALQELRLNGVDMTLETMAPLQQLLRVNKKLCALEIAKPRPGHVAADNEKDYAFA